MKILLSLSILFLIEFALQADDVKATQVVSAKFVTEHTRILASLANQPEKEKALKSYVAKYDPAHATRHAATVVSVKNYFKGVNPSEIQISLVQVNQGAVFVRITQPLNLDLTYAINENDKELPYLILQTVGP